MKLSHLVQLKNNLENLSLSRLFEETETLDAAAGRNYNLQLDGYYIESLNKIVDFFTTVENGADTLQNDIIKLIADIEHEITEITRPMMRLGYQVNGFYGSNLTNFDVERSDRQLELSDDERSEIGTVIRSYTHWKYPTLEIGPGDGDWTESLVAADPLYIIDRHQEFINSTLSKFNGTYQRRLRPYLTGIHANRSEFDYSMLPQGQFGFIFAWNVVNFWPYEETKHTLRQCYDLLRPGGAMMFSYNNCDVVQCAEYAESGYKSYLTPKLLNAIFEELGFVVKQYRSPRTHIHWAEIGKPGQLTTSKQHQTMGRICSVGA